MHDALGMDQGQKNGYAIGTDAIQWLHFLIPLKSLHSVKMLTIAVSPSNLFAGGAAVSPETVRYFLSLDMKVCHHL